MFVDIDCSQIKKFGQNAFGDYFSSKRTDNQDRLLAVLSDGLGSGIKANILSCMTTTMLLRFIEEDIPIQKAAQIVMDALPVCQIRKISYATFSAVDCRNDGHVWVVEEGNPSFLLMRQNQEVSSPCHTFTSPKFPVKVILPLPLLAAHSTKSISPPTAVHAKPVTTPARRSLCHMSWSNFSAPSIWRI